MALGYSEEMFGAGQNIQSLMQHFFQSYSMVLDKPSIKKIENKLEHFLHEEKVLLSADPYKVMHTLIFPEAAWFQQAQALDFLKKWFVCQQKSMRIWSVGSGLGYEPYSISCCFSEVLHSFSLNALPTLDILGSDVSAQALNFSKKAIYSKDSFGKGISWLRKRKFFQKASGPSNEFYELKFPEKERVRFIEQDILKNLHPLGFFDFIFCTQILPYFSKNLRYAVACRLSDRLNPGGYLFLGDVDINFKDLPNMRKVDMKQGFLYQKAVL